MKNPTLLFALLTASSLACASDGTQLHHVTKSGLTRIKAHGNSLTVQIDMGTGHIPREDPRHIGCRDNQGCYGVSQLKISVDGRSLFVPMSSFADLLNVKEARAIFSRGTATLVLSGGDAADGYRAEILFDSHMVRSRTLFSSLAPGEPLQKTEYYEVALD